MACVPSSPASYDMGPRDYLNRFVSLISSLRSGQARFLPLLQNKIAEVLPSYQLPIQARMEVYGNPSQSSTPIQTEGAAYDNPSSLSYRHRMSGIHYQEQGLSPIAPQIGGPSAYGAFNPAMQYQDAASSGSLPGSGLYQTHLPRHSDYPG